MSYVLVDEQGTVHDLATNVGLGELYTAAEEKGSKALQAMLDRGDATASEREAVLAEINGIAGFEDTAEALRGLTGRVVVSNGVEEDEV